MTERWHLLVFSSEHCRADRGSLQLQDELACTLSKARQTKGWTTRTVSVCVCVSIRVCIYILGPQRKGKKHALL